MFCASGLLLIVSCAEKKEWSCRIDGDNMYSVTPSGEIGSADRGCTCQQMRDFEFRKFGSVDEDALRRDFGCKPED